jgi:Tol biopolymer transport system component
MSPLRARLYQGLLLALLPLVSGAADDGRASALSPDGTHLVREARQAAGTILELVDVAGGRARPLVRLPGANRWPVWSPDGLFVAFCAEFKGRYFVTVTDMTGHSWMVQEIHGGLSRISWSADAVWLAYSSETSPGNRDLFLSTAGGTDRRQLTNTPLVSEDEPRWSSRNDRIVYNLRGHDSGSFSQAWLNPAIALGK